MAPFKTTIALVGTGPETAQIDASLRDIPDVVVERREGSLTELNGAAYTLASRQDIVLFRTEPGEGLDLEALRALNQAPDRHAVFVALTAPDLPLADVRRLMQAGVSEVLPWTTSPDELALHLQRWKRQNLPVIYEPPTRRGRVITVAQARGGIGASTLAVNLADRLLNRKGLRRIPQNRVAVIDLDFQFGSIASLLDLKENDAVYALATEATVPDAAFVDQALIGTPQGLWVLPAPTKFVPLEVITSAQIGALIDQLTQQFDYVVIDLPRTLVLWVSAVLERTDRMMLVTDCTVPSVRQARRLMDLYLENNPALQIEVVMSQEHRPLVRRSHHVEASKLLERPFRYWLPFDARAIRKAADRGVPLSAAAGSSQLSKAIAAVGRQTLASLERRPSK